VLFILRWSRPLVLAGRRLLQRLALPRPDPGRRRRLAAEIQLRRL